MRDELRVLNALIGMAHGAGGWPAPLRALGFQLTALQRDVGLELDGAQRIVTPEAVFQSLDENGCLVVESKSRSFEADQARRYWHLSATDLVAYGACSEPEDVTTHEVAPVYFCQGVHTEELLPQIVEFNNVEPATMPLVDYDNHRFGLQMGTVRIQKLHDLFDAGVHFEESHWPTRFVPFDVESPPGEMASPVMAELTALFMNPDVVEFTAADLAAGHPDTGSDGCVPFYGRVGANAQARYRVKIAALVERFRIAYISRHLKRTGPGPTWRKPDVAPSSRLLVALNASAKDFCRRVETDTPLPKEAQLSQLIGQEELEELVAEDDGGPSG